MPFNTFLSGRSLAIGIGECAINPGRSGGRNHQGKADRLKIKDKRSEVDNFSHLFYNFEPYI